MSYKMEIALSAQELSDETLSPTNLEQALSAIRDKGFVILEDLISHD